MLEINLIRIYNLSEIAKLLGMSESDIELVWNRWDMRRNWKTSDPHSKIRRAITGTALAPKSRPLAIG